jgi:hypothetical protein
VKVRAELAGHSSTEIAHVVGDRAETVRLTLAPPVDAAPPADAGIDAAPTTTRNEMGRRTGGTRKPPTGAASGSAPASSNSGSGSKNTFDPEGIAR